MRLAGYQPHYFPRLHYYNRILDSDIFEVSDYVQFVKKHAFAQSDGTTKRGKSYQAHAVIKLNEGAFHLAVPAKEEMLSINQTQIDSNQNWAEKHIKTLEVAYRKSKNFDKFFPEIQKILTQDHKHLADLNMKTVNWGILRMLTDEPIATENLTVEFINKKLSENTNPFRLKRVFLASESPVPAPSKGSANDWIIALCKYAGATEYYYGGTSHAAYMDIKKIEECGVKGAMQDWKIPEYSQQYAGAGFVANLSIIDLIMNEDLVTRQKIII